MSCHVAQFEEELEKQHYPDDRDGPIQMLIGPSSIRVKTLSCDLAVSSSCPTSRCFAVPRCAVDSVCLPPNEKNQATCQDHCA
jgi:hypothetical protein